MYYEEREIEGILMYRITPTAKWKPVSKAKMLEDENERLRHEVRELRHAMTRIYNVNNGQDAAEIMHTIAIGAIGA